MGGGENMTTWTQQEIAEAMAYRKAKQITHYYDYHCALLGGTARTILCPTCDYPFEREYVKHYCGCGQKLLWGSARRLQRKKNPNF